MKTCERIAVAPKGRPADANILRQYAIQKAAWIWHPDKGKHDHAVLRFRNRIELPEETELTVHVSGDQRYELTVDGQLVSCGPDRSDLAHWSFATLKMVLEKGEHLFEARVWWIGDKAPQAQTSYRGGFILAAGGEAGKLLDTGKGEWETAAVEGWSHGPAITADYEHYHDIGPSFIGDGAKLFAEPVWVPAAVVTEPIEDNIWGVVAEGWQLYPSRLPEQVNGLCSPGKVRAVSARADLGTVTADDMSSDEIAAWQELVDGTSTVTVPAGSSVQMIWDLENYYCGYERIAVSGGAGAKISVEWAESLYLKPEEGRSPRPKGNRDEIEDKVWWGFGSAFVADGGADREFSTLWWRSGRYIRVAVTAADEPLTISDVSFRETRYPLENDGTFEVDNELVNNLIPIAVRGMQMCDHELFADCPYYEQMMYVGDTRLQMLISSVMSADDRLIKRGIELFDWSRWKTGFTAERYPSRWFQLCPPFSLIWVLCIHDFSQWHDDPDFVRTMLPGVRGVLEQFRTLLNEDTMIEQIPGWSFFEYVPEWYNGDPPDGTTGVSALINLVFVNALRAAADLEEELGDALLALRNRELADETAEAVVRTCWSDERGMLADERSKTHFSEHGQILALLLDVLPEEKRTRCEKGLLTADDIQRATVYFKFYLHDVFYKMGRGDLILEDFGFWQNLIDNGFKTPVERPEPSRSDCHAWGSHPLWHMYVSLAGIRPGGFGFKKVRIAPSPGSLPAIKCSVPHPAGTITADMTFNGGAAEAVITLPEGTEGIFIWNNTEYPLEKGGTATIKAG